ncbi:MAG: FumA C-terminus/TtdB family hydratase beta subunit [Candidatus Omnitrophica bacterium]|nr:FumA C-terminus/TtdB family hydratase beta subunit [Candidatus Omnitrophota bacterium]
MKKITLPFDSKTLTHLEAGEELSLSGIIYTARDQAHKRLVALLKKRKKLPIDLKTSVIYYCGPNPGKGKFALGACGPTTSSRMDKLTLPLLKSGLKAVIGKGRRSEEVRRGLKKTNGVYLLAPSGCGALLAKKVRNAKVVAFSDLKSEAIFKLKVCDFPVIVGINSHGKDIYDRKELQC